MYLAFKEKMNAFRHDEYQRRNFCRQAEVAGVALFWIAFTVGLLVYGHKTELREKAMFIKPSVPEISDISKSVSQPAVEVFIKKEKKHGHR